MIEHGVPVEYSGIEKLRESGVCGDRMEKISSNAFLDTFCLSVRFYAILAKRGCCLAFVSSTMVDSFILQTGWGSLCNLLLLILALSYTLVSARLFPLQLTTKMVT
jgi:hypothetical protein